MSNQRYMSNGNEYIKKGAHDLFINISALASCTGGTIGCIYGIYNGASKGYDFVDASFRAIFMGLILGAVGFGVGACWPLAVPGAIIYLAKEES